MGRNVTITGHFVRKEWKKSFILWVWALIQDALVKEQVIPWQPMRDCVACHKQIVSDAPFCSWCAAKQREQMGERQTEAIQRLPSPTSQTEELRQVDMFETSEMRAIRIANGGQFLRQYLVEDRLYKWLYVQIENHYQDWEKLIATSKTYGFQQHVWLHIQLKERGATCLMEEFQKRCAAEKVMPWMATFTREKPGACNEQSAARRAK